MPCADYFSSVQSGSCSCPRAITLGSRTRQISRKPSMTRVRRVYPGRDGTVEYFGSRGVIHRAPPLLRLDELNILSPQKRSAVRRAIYARRLFLVPQFQVRRGKRFPLLRFVFLFFFGYRKKVHLKVQLCYQAGRLGDLVQLLVRSGAFITDLNPDRSHYHLVIPEASTEVTLSSLRSIHHEPTRAV
jgi:hypothetical protein